MSYDHGAAMNRMAGAEYERMSEDDDALNEKIEEFHRAGGLWIGPEITDFLGLDDAEERVCCGDDYGAWYKRKKACRTAAEIQAVQKEYTDLKSQWLAEAICQIAKEAIAWEAKKEEEDAA